MQPKQLICKEGDIGEEFYVIAHGQALVTKGASPQILDVDVEGCEPDSCVGAPIRAAEKNGRVIPLLTLSDGAYFVSAHAPRSD